MGRPRGAGKPNKRDGKHLNDSNNQSPIVNQPSTSKGIIRNPFSSLNNDQDLSDFEDAMSVTSSMSKRSKPSKIKISRDTLSRKPPPLTIEGDYSTVRKIINNVKSYDNDFEMSAIPIEINGKISSFVKVHASSTESYKKLKTYCERNGHSHFGHLLHEEQTSKFVLHGLYDISENELMQHLKEAKLQPTKVKKLPIKQKKFSDHNVYAIYFPRKDKEKITKLNEIKTINYVRVKWDLFSHKQKAPIQCSNCMLYGHGGANCRLKPCCIRCGKEHKSTNCPLLFDENKQPRLKIPDKDLTCGLCGQNHTANYSKCEKRQQFIERQSKHRPKAQRTNNTRKSFQPAPQLNDFNFPRLRPTQNMQSFSTRPLPDFNTTQNANNLFNGDELMSIFNEMCEKMQHASNKIQQIQVLGNIIIKHCYQN